MEGAGGLAAGGRGLCRARVPQQAGALGGRAGVHRQPVHAAVEALDGLPVPRLLPGQTQGSLSRFLIINV